jgi:putative transposase
MSDKFQHKYRIASARLQNWDYGSDTMYFVTICTQGREHYFGEIETGIMILSEIGKMAQQYWHEIPNHFTFVEFREFVVMPNHIHGIIIIDKYKNAHNDANVETPNLGVSTTATTNPNRQRTIHASEKWNPETLGVIINQYKRIVTINARKIHADFAWQTRFYDHIIRNDESFQRISNYIYNNPSKWTDDKFYNP